MIHSLFHLMYLHSDILSAASVPRPPSTYYLPSTCDVPGMGLSAIEADVAPPHVMNGSFVKRCGYRSRIVQDLLATMIFNAVSGTHPTDRLCLRQQGAGSAAVQALSPEEPGEFQAANEGQCEPGELRVGGSGGGWAALCGNLASVKLGFIPMW